MSAVINKDCDRGGWDVHGPHHWQSFNDPSVYNCRGNTPVETVNHPAHYNKHPSGVECIDVVEHMGFNLGNAIKYIWRADEKGNAIEDLKKAAWYLNREIAKREK